jgi:MFS family permease
MTPGLEAAPRLYTGRFYVLLGALFALMCGYSVLVHLAKYVVRIGGDTGTVGWIFGIGMAGSLVTRPFVGRWIDRAGCKPVLVVAGLGASAVILSFQWFDSVRAVCGLRVLLQLAQAAFLATVAVYSAQIAPPRRSAESLAMIGMGGLAGMMVGPMLGDAIFLNMKISTGSFRALFASGAALAFIAGLLALCLPTVPTPPRLEVGSSSDGAKETVDGAGDSYFHLVRKHWPGPILIMGICLAVVQTVPVMFIERFATARGLGGVTFFFVGYSPTAIALRLILRTLPNRIGRRWTLIFGMSCYVASLLLLVRVDTALGLLLPAVVGGVGHCFSYPFLVDLATERMPPAHRGLATSVILGVIDIGFIFSFIIEGHLIEHYGFGRALVAIAIAAGVGVAAYAWTQRRDLLGIKEQVATRGAG